MKNIFTLAEATEWLSRHSDFDVGERDVLLADAEGNLPICFRYRGTMGRFKNPQPIDAASGRVPTAVIFPRPIEGVYFDGYLRSLDSRCHLDTIKRRTRYKKTPDGMMAIRMPDTVEHVLTPYKVESVITLAMHPKRDIEALEGGFWGCVNDLEMILDRSNVPPGSWVFHIDDLMKYLSGEQAQREVWNDAGKPIITEPEPKRNNPWLNAMSACVRDYMDENVEQAPDKYQIWERLKMNPPNGYRIRWDDKKDTLTMDHYKPMSWKSFDERYRRTLKKLIGGNKRK